MVFTPTGNIFGGTYLIRGKFRPIAQAFNPVDGEAAIVFEMQKWDQPESANDVNYKSNVR